MNDIEHDELVKLEEAGKILIGVDRTAARKLFTEVPLSKIQEMTGETPYFEKILVMFAYLMGPVALISSVVLAFMAFNWWGLIPLLLCPVVYSVYQGLSSRGDAGQSLITVFVVVASLIHFFGNFNVPLSTGFVAVFLFSLWCIRFVYTSATLMYKAFAIRNRKAFDFLSSGLVIKDAENKPQQDAENKPQQDAENKPQQDAENKPQPINLSEMRAGFEGRPFSQLIEHELNRQNQDQRIKDLHGTVAMLSDKVGELVEDFIERWNLRGYDQSFWQTDAASILDEITQDAKNILSKKSLPIDDEILFNFFNIIVRNYAYSAYDQPKMCEFMGIPRGQDKKDETDNPMA